MRSLSGILKTRRGTEPINWTYNNTTCVNHFRDVAYGNNSWVAVSGSELATAVNPSDPWTIVDMLAITGGWLYGVAYGNGIWVTAGDLEIIATSTDRINWTKRTSATGTGSVFYDVFFDNGVFVAVGNKYGIPIIETSADGITWTSRVTPFTNKKILNQVAYGNGIWTIVTAKDGATGGEIGLSNDNGVTWISVTGISSESLMGVGYMNGTWVVSEYNTSIIHYTVDPYGVWSNLDTGISLYYGRPMYGNGAIVIAGTNVNKIATSTDVLSMWTERNNILSDPTFGATVYDTAYGGGYWVAVGSRGSLSYSIT